jgi:hypothetical protein
MFGTCSSQRQQFLEVCSRLTNFSLSKFDELTTLMVPTIQAHVKSISEGHIVIW